MARLRKNIVLAVDIVVGRRKSEKHEVLLVRRKSQPFKNMWALPGGFLEPYERVEEAARRELYEETGLNVARLELIGIFDEPARDPRGHVISVAFLARAGSKAEPRARSDATEAKWFSLASLPRLAFDHAKIISRARKLLRKRK